MAKKNRCPITSSPRKRAAANELAAAVKDKLPAGLAQPALRALAAAGLSSLDHFASVRESEVLKLHGMGPKAMKIIHEAMRCEGLSFCDETRGTKKR